jgi:hypothetical protein
VDYMSIGYHITVGGLYVHRISHNCHVVGVVFWHWHDLLDIFIIIDKSKVLLPHVLVTVADCAYPAPKDCWFYLTFQSNHLTLSVPDERYSRNSSCTLNEIYTFSLEYMRRRYGKTTFSDKLVIFENKYIRLSQIIKQKYLNFITFVILQ